MGFDVSLHLLIININIFFSKYNSYRKGSVHNMIGRSKSRLEPRVSN